MPLNASHGVVCFVWCFISWKFNWLRWTFDTYRHRCSQCFHNGAQEINLHLFVYSFIHSFNAFISELYPNSSHLSNENPGDLYGFEKWSFANIRILNELELQIGSDNRCQIRSLHQKFKSTKFHGRVVYSFYVDCWTWCVAGIKENPLKSVSILHTMAKTLLGVSNCWCFYRNKILMRRLLA